MWWESANVSHIWNLLCRTSSEWQLKWLCCLYITENTRKETIPIDIHDDFFSWVQSGACCFYGYVMWHFIMCLYLGNNILFTPWQQPNTAGTTVVNSSHLGFVAAKPVQHEEMLLECTSLLANCIIAYSKHPRGHYDCSWRCFVTYVYTHGLFETARSLLKSNSVSLPRARMREGVKQFVCQFVGLSVCQFVSLSISPVKNF